MSIAVEVGTHRETSVPVVRNVKKLTQANGALWGTARRYWNDTDRMVESFLDGKPYRVGSRRYEALLNCVNDRMLISPGNVVYAVKQGRIILLPDNKIKGHDRSLRAVAFSIFDLRSWDSLVFAVPSAFLDELAVGPQCDLTITDEAPISLEYTLPGQPHVSLKNCNVENYLQWCGRVGYGSTNVTPQA